MSQSTVVRDLIAQIGGLHEVVVRLGVATLIGSVLGLNRELRNKPAGMRTHALVALGAALLTLMAMQFGIMESGKVNSNAMSRVVQGVITGIGFLGGGVILRDQQKRDVHGLTTAASIWVAAALGISCGAGAWPTAVVALGFTLFVLIVGGPVEGWLYRWVHKKDPPNGP
jgi:putative Mg2+ transporter-C (MgtC) family protein